MRLCFASILIFMGALSAEVTIGVKADKSSLSINDTLTVDITLVYPTRAPPDLFPFFYEMTKARKYSFQIVSQKEGEPLHKDGETTQVLQVTLQPMHTGTLIFAPGIITFANQGYLVPALTVTCVPTGLSTLPLAGLLPLYPERRIDLSPANRMALMREEVLSGAREKNLEAVRRYRFAWDSLAGFSLIIAASALASWAIWYYELLQRAILPLPAKESKLQRLVREVQKPDLVPSARWEKLAELVREALSVAERQNLRYRGLFELADYVQASSKLSPDDKTTLAEQLNRLGAICYAAAPATDEEWLKMSKFLLALASRLG